MRESRERNYFETTLECCKRQSQRKKSEVQLKCNCTTLKSHCKCQDLFTQNNIIGHCLSVSTPLYFHHTRRQYSVSTMRSNKTSVWQYCTSAFGDLWYFVWNVDYKLLKVLSLLSCLFTDKTWWLYLHDMMWINTKTICESAEKQYKNAAHFLCVCIKKILEMFHSTVLQIMFLPSVYVTVPTNRGSMLMLFKSQITV